jgi:hypothetical protein
MPGDVAGARNVREIRGCCCSRKAPITIWHIQCDIEKQHVMNITVVLSCGVVEVVREGSSYTRRRGLALPSTARRSSEQPQPHETYNTAPPHSITPSPVSQYPLHTYSRQYGFISGAVQPTGRRRGRPVRGRAAGAIQWHPRAISQVCSASSSPGTDIRAQLAWRLHTDSPRIVSVMAARNDGRLLQPQLPHQDRPRYHNACLPLQGRHHRRHRFASNSRKLDSKSDGQEGH